MCAWLIYLQEHLESVQGGCEGPRHHAGDATGDQMPPPHAGQHFFLREVIWHVQVVAKI